METNCCKLQSPTMKKKNFYTSTVKFVVFVGKATLSVPLDCGRNIPSWLYRLYLAFHVLLSLSSTILMIDSCTTNHPYVFAASEKISVLIATYIVYLSAVLPDLVIRSGTFLLRDQLNSLNSKIKLGSGVGFNPPKNILLQLGWIFLCTCWMILRSYNLTTIAIVFTFTNGYTMTLIPFGNYVIRMAYIFTNGLCSLSMYYATLYVVLIGDALVKQLEDYVKRFRSSAQLRGGLRSVCRSSSCKSEDISQSLLAEFHSLKSSFEQYGNVAGVYFVAIFMHLTMCIIRFISDVKTGSETRSHLSVWFLATRIQYGSYLIGLPVLANFGHWMTTQVRTS